MPNEEHTHYDMLTKGCCQSNLEEKKKKKLYTFLILLNIHQEHSAQARSDFVAAARNQIQILQSFQREKTFKKEI